MQQERENKNRKPQESESSATMTRQVRASAGFEVVVQLNVRAMGQNEMTSLWYIRKRRQASER